MYQIESKSDLAGAMLVIRFPEEDLDTKALYTIQADQPEFLVPFRYRCVDGKAECTYHLGNRVKLLYHCSSKSPGELTGFWEKILQPLLDCGDWFLKPFSFVLDMQYLYTSRDGGTISYLYVPSKQDCGDMEALREMAAALAEKNPSTDANLEVMVLRAIMQDFQPHSFLQMLRKNQPATLAKSLISPETPASAPTPPPAVQQLRPAAGQEEPKQTPSQESGDIVINLSGKKASKKGGLFGNKEEKKKEKKPKKEKKEGGLFCKKKEANEPKKDEIMLGAAAGENSKPVIVNLSTSPGLTEAPEEEGEGLTTMDDIFFRLVGDQRLPRQIPVALNPGELFTIGRFDVKVGRRQSSFEFDSKTKAISRHHAAVERKMDGSYTLTDLDSTAGTFVDGERLAPNVPRQLAQGSRVSFGTAGADYIWEERDWEGAI